MKGSPGGEAGRPDRSEARIAFYDSTEAETGTEYAISSTVLSIERELVALTPFTLRAFLQARRNDKFCRESAELVRGHQLCFSYDPCGILVQKGKLVGAEQRAVPEQLGHRLLHLAY